MADLTVAQGDNYPPVRGRASDEDGVMDLTGADWLRFIMRHENGTPTIAGTATVIDPVDTAGNNWQYAWGTADTSVVGTYDAELEIHWNDGAPGGPQIETVPNEAPLEIVIRDDLA